MMKPSVYRMRAGLLPLLLAAVYVAQHYFPSIKSKGMLLAGEARWWQFGAYGFLSANTIHLAAVAAALYVIVAQFAPRLRAGTLLAFFVGFSALSAFFYYHWLMPAGAGIVGASGGAYALLGFCGGWRPHDRIGLPGLKFGVPIPAGAALIIAVEAVIAHYWLSIMGWPLHALGFATGALAGWGARALSSPGQRTPGPWTIRRLLEIPEEAGGRQELS